MELCTGDLFFKTNTTLEHLAMIEKIAEEPFPSWMVENSKLEDITDMFKTKGSGKYSADFRPEKIPDFDPTYYKHLYPVRVL